ncbi:TPA: hypothetical protein ACPSKE_002632 [Legionella feeleii]
MGCIIEFPLSFLKFEFCSQGSKQKILVDVLLKYSGMDIQALSAALEIPIQKLENICNDVDFLVGEQADDLAQLFLIFFGSTFFRQTSIRRNFNN